jgi:hypothetical protein
MKHDDDLGRGGPAIQLVRETLDGLGRLVSQHVKLARLELSADLRAMGTRVASVVALALLMLLGYALTMVGLALLLAGDRRLAFAFGAVGLVHLLGAGAAMLVLVARGERLQVMKSTATELAHSADALIAATGISPHAASSDDAPTVGVPRLETNHADVR